MAGGRRTLGRLIPAVPSRSRLLGVALVPLVALGACSSGDAGDDEEDRADTTTTEEPTPETTATTGTTEPPGPAAVELYDAACADELSVTAAGRVPDDLASISGLAASVRHDGVLWAIEDSFNPAQLVALGLDGAELARIDLRAGLLSNVDWEDIAVAPGPDGTSWVWVADIGDNLGVRTEREVYGFPEPDLDETAVQPRTYRLRFDSARPDAEAIAVVDGILWLIDKPEDGPTTLYRAEIDGEPDGPGPGDQLRSRYVLRPVTTVEVGGERVTGMDVSADGTLLAVRTYDSLRLHPIGPGADLGDAVSTAPCMTPAPPERQGESVAILAGAEGLATVSEDERDSPDPIELHLTER